jgi:hypothetical protein
MLAIQLSTNSMVISSPNISSIVESRKCNTNSAENADAHLPYCYLMRICGLATAAFAEPCPAAAASAGFIGLALSNCVIIFYLDLMT